MKNIALCIILFCSSLNTNSQNTVNPIVDERTELLSIVFRLSGAPEYVNRKIEAYSKSIDEYFEGYKEYEVVKLAKKLRGKSGVSYDAVMSLALNLRIDNQIIINTQIIENNLDKRWKQKDLEVFLKSLNRFYVESDFHSFFESNMSLYKMATNQFSNSISSLNFEWYSKFTGVTIKGNFNVILSMVNTGCYGIKVDYKNQQEDYFAIMGPWKTDSTGQPLYHHPDIFLTLIHEFNHSIFNHYILEHFKEVEPEADKLYKKVSEQMQKHSYGNSKTMLCEFLARSMVILYSKEHNVEESRINQMITSEKNQGFLWIDKMVDKIAYYQRNRDKYPTFETYMPQIIELIKGIE